jgi:hypothetical protein
MSITMPSPGTVQLVKSPVSKPGLSTRFAEAAGPHRAATRVNQTRIRLQRGIRCPPRKRL